MKSNEHTSDKTKVEELINYYQDSGLLIVGLNDSQGVNTTPFLKKCFLDYLRDSLTSKDLEPLIINAFSLTMNKTEHIDYFLKNNVSLEEIRLSQIYSTISALEKLMRDIGLNNNIDGISNLLNRVDYKNDNKVHLATSLQEAQEPVLIYSSGVNNLMREVGANPFGIKRDYKTRSINPNYSYTLEQAKNPTTLKRVMDSIERNYDTILGINSSTDIYTLGAYIPKSLQREGLDIFRDLIISYNEELIKLCSEYGITFVNTEEIGNRYNTSNNSFHISSIGHVALANCILDYMYKNKVDLQKPMTRKTIDSIDITNKGAEGVLDNVLTDCEISCLRAVELSGYEKERELDIAMEHKREIEIFQKVLTKVQNN